MVLKNLAIKDTTIGFDTKTCDFLQNTVYKDSDTFNDM